MCRLLAHVQRGCVASAVLVAIAAVWTSAAWSQTAGNSGARSSSPATGGQNGAASGVNSGAANNPGAGAQPGSAATSPNNSGSPDALNPANRIADPARGAEPARGSDVPGTEAYDRARSVPGTGDPRDTLRSPRTRSGIVPGNGTADGEAADNPAARAGRVPEAADVSQHGAIGVTLGNGDGGLTVGTVAPSSPAFAAGLRPGDLVLGIDGKSFQTIEEATLYISRLEPGREVALIVQRAGRPARLTARVGMWSHVYPNYGRYTALSPAAPDGGADLTALRAEIQSLRDEVRELRKAIYNNAPKPDSNAQPDSAPSGSRTTLPPLP